MTSTTRRFGVSLMAVLVAGCLRGGPRPCSDQDSDILVIGDSVLRFHSEACASVPDVLGERLGRSVRNEAVKGARVTAGPLYAFGDLHGQYEVGDWDWVVVEGGINDLRGRCGSGRGDAILESLVSPDGERGEVPALVDGILEDGARVALVGYYPVFDDAYFQFGDCNPELDQLRTRYAALAERRDEVVFVDPGDVVSPTRTPGAYLRDGIHPSEEGSRMLGELLAEAMTTAD